MLHRNKLIYLKEHEGQYFRLKICFQTRHKRRRSPHPAFVESSVIFSVYSTGLIQSPPKKKEILMSINFIDPYVCSAQSMCGQQAAVTESDGKMGELISMWTWLHKLVGLSSPVCAGFDTSWCKNEFVFLSYLSKIMVVTHDLYGCEAETSRLMLCSRLHSWTELVFVRTDWDLACIPSWLCSLGEYSRRGNIPHIFACCRHYFKHNKNQKTTFSVSSLFVCRLAV